MRPLREHETKTTRGVKLRLDPARESCFEVVHLHSGLKDFVGMGVESMQQRLHRHMHNEMQNCEITAQTLVDFPDVDWETRLQLARQCWDEARHTKLVRRRLEAHGGHKGQFPVMNYEWGVVCLMDSLEGRLTLQNRTFEAGEMDLFRQLMGTWAEVGDSETVEMLDGILADEVQHVRFGNRWLKRAARSNPRVLLTVARALQHLKRITAALAPNPGDKNAAGVDLTNWQHLQTMPNVEDRELAEFDRAEIAELLRREGFGQLAAGAASDAVGPD
jgi:uncharacterized ferritin-like protein (DUF455 family)